MWYNKDQICETKPGKRVSPSKGAGILDTVASTGADLLIHHGIPWLGKKAVEMGRYYGSVAPRNPKLQKKAIDYALDQLNPMIQNVGSQALDQLSTKIRPKKNYKSSIGDGGFGAFLRNCAQTKPPPILLFRRVVRRLVHRMVQSRAGSGSRHV